MDKKSTLFYFFNTYQNEGLGSNYLSLNDGEHEVSGDKDYQGFFKPSVKSVNAILNFAKSYEVIHSESAGCIEMNKN